ncbi:MAG: heat shock protein GrpE [candidate division BRC1 bacterium ADurb.BinA364]|nr:MAG: heat shock protein GrpE [candidate division BRC1 bacterium ADurb.BinA364]
MRCASGGNALFYLFYWKGLSMKQPVSSSSRPNTRGRRRVILRLRRAFYQGRPAPEARRSGQSIDHGIDERIARLEAERDSARESYFRSRAEFENFRKRMLREQEEYAKRAGESVLRQLLPVMDNFSRAIDAAPPAPQNEGFVDGVRMIRDQIAAVFASQGMEKVKAEGETFDPALHEAIGVDARDDVADNTITLVLQEGYTLHGKLLRPAMVRVAKKSS